VAAYALGARKFEGNHDSCWAFNPDGKCVGEWDGGEGYTKANTGEEQLALKLQGGAK
jgi:hypothetical protein